MFRLRENIFSSLLSRCGTGGTGRVEVLRLSDWSRNSWGSLRRFWKRITSYRLRIWIDRLGNRLRMSIFGLSLWLIMRRGSRLLMIIIRFKVWKWNRRRFTGTLSGSRERFLRNLLERMV